MFSKSKNSERIEPDQREQYEYARRRILQKKNLMRHFIFFLAGSVLFIVLDVLKVVEGILGTDWYIWAILIWAFFFLIHVLNVFILNSFMGKEWEDQQLQKLKVKQAEKMVELQKRVDTELPLPNNTSKTYNDPLNNPIPSQLK